MSSKDFVSFLVDETLKLQKSGEVELSSLELKLTDYGLDFLKGEFIPQTQILRFKTPFGNLDVPINWSIFSIIKSKVIFFVSCCPLIPDVKKGLFSYLSYVVDDLGSQAGLPTLTILLH
jgi:hypothetical protein